MLILSCHNLDHETSWSMDCWRSEDLSADLYTVYNLRSSANILTTVFPKITESTSFINIRNNIGPKQNPVEHHLPHQTRQRSNLAKQHFSSTVNKMRSSNLSVTIIDLS